MIENNESTTVSEIAEELAEGITKLLAKILGEKLADLDVVVVRRPNSVDHEEDEESALRKAMRTLVAEGHEFVSVYQVMNEMSSLLGNTWGAESKADIPAWQRPKVLGKKVIGHWLDENQVIRKRIDHEEIGKFRPRFYRILDDRKGEILGELAKEGAAPMVQMKRKPGDFCLGCTACKYRKRCFIRQEYGNQTAKRHQLTPAPLPMNTDQTAVADPLMDWLAANLGDESLAPLSGTDTRALRAAWAIIVLWNRDDGAGCDELLVAFAACVRRMGPHTQQFAYHAIAQVMNWSDRPKVWARAGLPQIQRPWRCKHEDPQG
jgi:hypothetical protein